MNIRISAIATSVMLVTVMPRNSRQFFLNPSRQTRLRVEQGPTLRAVRNTPVRCTVKLILSLTIDASGISGADIL